MSATHPEDKWCYIMNLKTIIILVVIFWCNFSIGQDRIYRCGNEYTNIVDKALEKSCVLITTGSESEEAKPSFQGAKKDAPVVSVFGMLLGSSTADEIRRLVKVKDPSLCKVLPNSHCGFSMHKYGGLSKLDNYIGVDDSSADLLNIFFANFSIDGNDFQGVFFNGVLIELSLVDMYESNTIKRSMVPELRASFNKKYKRLKSQTKNSSSDYARYSYLYERWQEPLGAFSVELVETRQVVTNSDLCFALASNLRNTVSGIRLLAKCDPVMNNVPEYSLTYRFDSGHDQAFALLDELDKKQKKSSEDAKKSNLMKF